MTTITAANLKDGLLALCSEGFTAIGLGSISSFLLRWSFDSALTSSRGGCTPASV